MANEIKATKEKDKAEKSEGKELDKFFNNKNLYIKIVLIFLGVGFLFYLFSKMRKKIVN